MVGIADVPMPVDGALFGIVAGLAVIAGISVGVVYRTFQAKNDALAERAANAEIELKTLLTVTDDAILVLGSEGTICAANPAAEEFFARSAEQLCRAKVSDVIPLPFALATATRNGPASFEATASRTSEGEVPVEVVLTPIELAHGRRYLLLTRPRTNAVSGNVAAPIAKHCHELNNHLTGVTGNISLVLMSGIQDGTTRERVTNAKRFLLKAQEVVKKVQAIAKGEVDTAREPAATISKVVPMPKAVTSSKTSGPRVLVLDDEPSIASLLCGGLLSEGYDAIATHDAKEAIEACEEALKSDQRFDLVITDLSLPGEFDGHKAVARMRAMDGNLKSIVSSGYDHDPIMLDYREHGFSAAISKPYDMEYLLKVVRDVLAGRGSDKHAAKAGRVVGA